MRRQRLTQRHSQVSDIWGGFTTADVGNGTGPGGSGPPSVTACGGFPPPKYVHLEVPPGLLPRPSCPPPPKGALEGKGPERRPQRRLGRRLEEVAEAVGGGYCRLQMPSKPALAVRGTVAGHRLGALEGGGLPMPPPPPARALLSKVLPCAASSLCLLQPLPSALRPEARRHSPTDFSACPLRPRRGPDGPPMSPCSTSPRPPTLRACTSRARPWAIAATARRSALPPGLCEGNGCLLEASEGLGAAPQVFRNFPHLDLTPPDYNPPPPPGGSIGTTDQGNGKGRSGGRPMDTMAYGGKGQGKGKGRGEGQLGQGGRGRTQGGEKPMGTTADGGKGSKGRAANGDRPIGAASCRREQYTRATCQPPPPPPPHAPGPLFLPVPDPPAAVDPPCLTARPLGPPAQCPGPPPRTVVIARYRRPPRRSVKRWSTSVSRSTANTATTSGSCGPFRRTANEVAFAGSPGGAGGLGATPLPPSALP